MSAARASFSWRLPSTSAATRAFSVSASATCSRRAYTSQTSAASRITINSLVRRPVRSFTAFGVFRCFAMSALSFPGPIPTFPYCKAFAPKIKEVFSAAERFFIKISGPPQRQAQKTPQKGQRIRPKSPQRAQKLRKSAEKQDRAPQGSQDYKSPELALGPAQQEEEHGPAHRQAVGPVQKGGGPGSPHPEGAQQIIQQPGGQPQENGLPEHQQLLGRPAFHAQPNRRPRKPPRPEPWSS